MKNNYQTEASPCRLGPGDTEEDGEGCGRGGPDVVR